jgi:nucleotide-binding universal stress UspA family protein
MKQILVAVDEHPHSEQIVDAAIQLAKATSAKILLIYVVSNKAPPAGYRESEVDDRAVDFTKDEYLRAVGPLLQRMEKAEIPYEGINSIGNPEEQIIKTAKTKDVDYIVVGTRGLRRLNRVRAIGSVSRSVIENSKVPVLAVP